MTKKLGSDIVSESFYLRKLVSKIFQKMLTNNYSNDKIYLVSYLLD